MNESSINNKRMSRNTLLLYFRMFLTIGIQLYTVPIVLRTLGVEDYGLYNVIGGITAFLGFISSSMASGSQRFFAFAIGRNDQLELKRTFDTTLTIYVIIAITSFILFELIGTWFVNCKLVYAEGRGFAANVVFQFSVLAFIIRLWAIPYNAVVIAHEKMDFFAYVSIANSILTLLLVLSLEYFGGDLLIIYAGLIFLVTLLERLIYGLYCKRNFIECRIFTWSCDKKIGKSLLVYSGFNMIGALAYIFRNQGMSILVNLFYGTIINASHAIANQISQVANTFITNLYTATRPQITKYHAAEQHEEMWKLVYRSSLLSFYLLTLLAIPLIIELQYILDLWLEDVPEYTKEIACVFILMLLVETTTNQIIAVFQAYNKIKSYQLWSSTILLLTLPVAFFILKTNSSNALLPYFIQVIFSVLYSISILIIGRRVLNLNIVDYSLNVIIRDITVFALSYSVTYFIIKYFAPSFLRLMLTCVVSMSTTCILAFSIGLNKADRHAVVTIIKSKIRKLKFN